MSLQDQHRWSWQWQDPGPLYVPSVYSATKNATICYQLITVPPRFFYPRPRGPYDGRGASTIRRGTRRIVEQMKMMQKVSHSINSYLILCFRIQRNQFLPSPASSQGNEVQRAWRRKGSGGGKQERRQRRHQGTTMVSPRTGAIF